MRSRTSRPVTCKDGATRADRRISSPAAKRRSVRESDPPGDPVRLHPHCQPGVRGSSGPPSYGSPSDPRQPSSARAVVRLGRRGHSAQAAPRRTDRSPLPPPTYPLGRRPVAAPRPPRGGTQCTTDPRPRHAPCPGTDHRLFDLLVDLALDDRARHDEFLDPGDCPVAAPTFASAAPAGDAWTPPRTAHAYSLPALAR